MLLRQACPSPTTDSSPTPRPSLQVKLSVTHHTLSAANETLTADKPLVFAMEPFKDPGEKKKDNKKKKQKKTHGLNSKNFGSALNISKMKNAQRFVIGWRARLGLEEKDSNSSACFS